MSEQAILSFTEREKPTYIAGPYSANTEGALLRNIEKAMAVANELMRAGHLVYCPHLSHHLELHDNGGFGWQWWINYDLEWLRRCGRLVRIPGESLGADIEVAEALAIGMRVYWWDDAEDWAELLRMYAAPAEPGDILAAGSGSPR